MQSPGDTASVLRSVRQYEFIVNSIGEMISVIDADRVYLAVNDEWCRMTGLAREAVIGRHADSVMGRITQPDHVDALRRCLDRGEAQVVRVRTHLPGRAARTLLSRYYPYCDRSGDSRSAVVVTRDVTVEDAIALERQHHADNLRLVLEATGDAMIAVDGLDNVLFVNQRFIDLWPLPPEVVLRGAQAIREATLEWVDDAALERARIEGIYDSGTPSSDHLLLRDGREIERRSVPVPVPGQDRPGRLWSLRDVTAERRAMRTLAASEADARRLALVAEHTSNAVVITDVRGRIEWVNPAFVRLTGHAPDAARGRVPGDLLQGPGTDTATVALMRDKLAAGQPFHVEILNYRRDGTNYWVEIDVQPVRDAHGRPVNYIAIQSDITQRKQREAELIEARRVAEEASRAKSAFLSSMSHELRTPLNAVLGFAQLLSMNPRRPLADDQRRYLEEIERGGRHLLALIEQLLDLSRIEAGRMPLALAPMDLQDLLNECVAFIAPLAAERSIVLDKLCSPDRHPPVQADAMRVKQVLINLLSNAVKYNRPGGRIEVECSNKGACLRVEVRDTGPGLTADQCERLFRPFERLGADGGPIAGTGVGLALSRQLMELMDGRIGVSSTPGAGSTFWIELPLA